MSSRFRKRLAATVAAASLALVGGVAASPAAVAAPAGPSGSDLDYPSYAFPGLREGSVITPVTFERFERLLETDGTYAFLIGGPADATTNATITHIDAVAQEYGIDTVYTFDPRLDGESIDIRTTALTDLSALWTKAVATLNKDTTPAFGGDIADDPYLFVYDRSHTVGGAEDRIVAQLGGAVDAASVATDEGAAAYRAQVAGVFDAIATEGRATVSTQSQFEFFRDAVNGKHLSQYGSNTAAYGAEIFTSADAAGFRLKSISYPELVQVLDTPGDHVILFGGTWCHNTRAVIKDVNRAAAAAGTETVYVFDLRLDGASSNDLHIRDSNSDIAYLYGDIVAEYFPNLRTQYVTSGQGANPVNYHPGGDTTIAKVAAKKLQVPYLIEYDNANTAAPIAQDWLRDKGDGTFTEYMTEWWWVAGLPGHNSRGAAPDAWAASQRAAWDFADEAIAKIDGFFALASAPSAPATPAVAVAGDQAVVTWAAPSNGGSAITGYRVSLDGAAPVTVAAGTTSQTFTGVGAGSHGVTVTAVNYLGASPASASASFAVTAPTGSPSPSASPTTSPSAGTPASTAKVTVAGDLQPGGRIVVTGSGLPASTPNVTVEIRSTPQTLGTVSTTADGGFRLETTIPSSIPGGAHNVVVLIDGQVVASAAVTLGGLAASGGVVPFVVVGLALALLVAGVALQTVRRRRASA